MESSQGTLEGTGLPLPQPVATSVGTAVLMQLRAIAVLVLLGAAHHRGELSTLELEEALATAVLAPYAAEQGPATSGSHGAEGADAAPLARSLAATLTAAVSAAASAAGDSAATQPRVPSAAASCREYAGQPSLIGGPAQAVEVPRRDASACSSMNVSERLASGAAAESIKDAATKAAPRRRAAASRLSAMQTSGR